MIYGDVAELNKFVLLPTPFLMCKPSHHAIDRLVVFELEFSIVQCKQAKWQIVDIPACLMRLR